MKHMKLCRDCRHYTAGLLPLCGHPLTALPDPVEGGTTRPTCTSARLGFGAKCGEAGALYEAKSITEAA
jgi:hypothetical protein